MLVEKVNASVHGGMSDQSAMNAVIRDCCAHNPADCFADLIVTGSRVLLPQIAGVAESIFSSLGPVVSSTAKNRAIYCKSSQSRSSFG